MRAHGWNSSVRVLVTRALEEARRTADELARRGHEAIVAPLADVRFLGAGEPDLASVQAILATSSNGVRAFAGRCERRDIPVLTVGGSTAACARSAGFTDVRSAEGDATALVAMVRRVLDPAAGVLLHVTGKSRAEELNAGLAEAGFTCRVLELYEIVARRNLPERVVEAFRRNEIDAVLVLSPESGRIMAGAIKAGDVAAECDRVVACCISESAAAKIRGVQFGAVRIAEIPTLDAVLVLLEPGLARASVDRA